MLKKTALVGAVSLSFVSTVFAEETDKDLKKLDPVSVTGLRAVPPADVSASVTVLEVEDLEIRNSPFLADQLRAVPGVAISTSGGQGSLSSIRTRGSEANHTLVLLNGVEVADAATELNLGILQGLNISRIEFARGEQSVLHGSEAIGGVIFVETDIEGKSAAIEVGSRDTARGNIGFGFGDDTANIGFNVSGFTTSGIDITDNGDDDGSNSFNAMVQAGKTLSENWSAQGFATYRVSDLDIDSFAGDESEATQYVLGAAVTGDTGAVNHVIRLGYTDVTNTTFVSGSRNSETQGERTKLSYSPSISFDGTGASVTVSGLIEYENEDYERFAVDTTFGDPNQSQSFESMAFAGEVRAKLHKLALNGSVRRDDNDGRFENATTWRLGAAYDLGKFGKARASGGEAVKNPTFTELFGFTPANFVGNPDLIPEESIGWEIGYDFTNGPVSVSATYFDSELENEIFSDFSGFPAVTAANRATKSERKGVELAASFDVSETVTINAAFTNLTSEENGVDEIRRPENTASLALSWRDLFRDGTKLGLAADYVGEQTDNNFSTFPATLETLDEYVLVSATAEYPITEKLSVTLRGENLFDEDVVDVFGFNTPGAGVFIGLKLR